MFRIAKALHLIGLAMFLGSILGHIVAGLIPAADTDPEVILHVRQEIRLATLYLTIPGLVLLVLSGIWMTIHGRLGIGQIGWLTAHQLIGLFILLNAGLVLVPTGAALLEGAYALRQAAVSPADFQTLVLREKSFGAVNLLLTLITIFVAVLKPRLRRASH